MQETVKSKPTFAIGVAAAVLVVMLAAVLIVYGIFTGSYSSNLDKLKAMAETSRQQFDSGDTDIGATLTDELAFYTDLKGRIENLPVILEKLNSKYTMLPDHSTNESLGLSSLTSDMAALAPKLDELKQCIDEDTAITGKLKKLLGQGDEAGLPQGYADLIAENETLSGRVAAISLAGAIEDRRAAFAKAISSRADVLGYLREDADIHGQLATLLEDTKAAPADLKARFTALLAKNDTLAASAKGLDLKSYSSADKDIQQQLSDRGALIRANIAYMGELETVQKAVAAFCDALDRGPAQSGKFAQRLASVMGWIKQLKDLEKQLATVNANKAYGAITAKRSIADIGMTPAGQALVQYEAALNAVNAGFGSFNAIEKQINTLLADTKMALTSKITALEVLSSKNDDLITAISVKVPDNLTASLDNYITACRLRTTFLQAYIGYLEDRTVADTFKTTYQYYLGLRKEYLNTAKDYLAIDGKRSANVIYYEDLADDQVALANDQLAQYNDAIASCDAHKKEYEAARTKYLAVLNS
jgi:hypothetical protein